MDGNPRDESIKPIIRYQRLFTVAQYCLIMVQLDLKDSSHSGMDLDSYPYLILLISGQSYHGAEKILKSKHTGGPIYRHKCSSKFARHIFGSGGILASLWAVTACDRTHPQNYGF